MRPTDRLKAAKRKNLPDLRALLLKSYPKFVYGGGCDSVPIFTFHEVNAASLGAQLQYLSDNGYRTLNASEFASGQFNSDTKAVVLTFDDGHISLWREAHPLLEQFGFVGVSFICPELIDSDAPAEGASERILCSWVEICAMHQAGTVDFQSHALHHDLVFTSSRLRDWLDQDFQCFLFSSSDQPNLLGEGELLTVSNLAANRMEFQLQHRGTPIFDLAPRLAAPQRFLPSERCQTLFCESANRIDGLNREWRAESAALLRSMKTHEIGRFMPHSEHQASLLHELRTSKEQIEQRLGKRVDYLCAPWYQMTKLSKESAFEVGFKGLFLGEDAYRSQQPGCFPRLANRYIYRLPGKGRRPLTRMVTQKLGLSLS